MCSHQLMFLHMDSIFISLFISFAQYLVIENELQKSPRKIISVYECHCKRVEANQRFIRFFFLLIYLSFFFFLNPSTWVVFAAAARACAHESAGMALCSGALRVKLLVNRCGLSRFPSSVGLRAASSNTPSRAAIAGDPETTDDHLIYTREHLALKESLKKVCKTKQKVAASIEANENTLRVVFVSIDRSSCLYICILDSTGVSLRS